MPDHLLRGFANQDRVDLPDDTLLRPVEAHAAGSVSATALQLEIMNLADDGATDLQIASGLSLSIRTVEKFRRILAGASAIR